MPNHRTLPARRARRGAAVVEFSLTASLLFLLVFASFEFSRANVLLHTAAISATEGARAGIISGATADDVRNAAFAELDVLGIQDATVLVEPENISQGTNMVSVGVMVPLTTQNFYLTPRFFLGRDVIKVVSISREAKSGKDAAATAKDRDTKVAGNLKSGKGVKKKKK